MDHFVETGINLYKQKIPQIFSFLQDSENLYSNDWLHGKLNEQVTATLYYVIMQLPYYVIIIYHRAASDCDWTNRILQRNDLTTKEKANYPICPDRRSN